MSQRLALCFFALSDVWLQKRYGEANEDFEDDWGVVDNLFAAILLIGHSRVAPNLCFKARLSYEANDRKWFFILVEISLLS